MKIVTINDNICLVGNILDDIINIDDKKNHVEKQNFIILMRKEEIENITDEQITKLLNKLDNSNISKSETYT